MNKIEKRILNLIIPTVDLLSEGRLTVTIIGNTETNAVCNSQTYIISFKKLLGIEEKKIKLFHKIIKHYRTVSITYHTQYLNFVCSNVR